MAEAELVRFVDTHTIEYVRSYPHPIERVWRAITDPAEFGVWFIRGEIDLRKGGAYQHEGHWGGVVLDLDPPRFIRFDNSQNDGDGSWYQFELAPSGSGTRMVFRQHARPGAHGGLVRNPGGTGGWHEFWDVLGDFLDGAPMGSSWPATPASDLAASWFAKMEASGAYTARQAARATVSFRRHERWLELTAIYDAHIKAARPPAAPLEDG